MELGSLADIVDEYPATQMTEPQIAWVSLSILQALSFLADMKCVHRDIRTDNILVNSHGEIKLADMAHSLQLKKAGPRPGSTTPGTAYWWMAPEVISRRDYGTEVDTHSHSWSVESVQQRGVCDRSD